MRSSPTVVIALLGFCSLAACSTGDVNSKKTSGPVSASATGGAGGQNGVPWGNGAEQGTSAGGSQGDTTSMGNGGKAEHAGGQAAGTASGASGTTSGNPQAGIGGGAQGTQGGAGGSTQATQGGAGGSTSTQGGGTSTPQSGRLTGVNWFGFETSNYSPHGLWVRDYKSMLQQVKDLGFNTVRLPWCNDMLKAQPLSMQISETAVDPYTNKAGLNADLAGLSSIEIMDKILEECGRIGLKVILDNHSRAHDGYMQETIWYKDGYPEETWISDWVSLVKRYKDYPAVVAVDLKNEPHGSVKWGMRPPATWGYKQDGFGDTDWRGAAVRGAKAILAENPNLIIIVEGVEDYKEDGYWWGGNLKGVVDAPITSSEIPTKNLWYSAHEYGPEVSQQPWFTDSSFPANMPTIWDEKFWFIRKQNIAPLFFGEFGIKEASAADTSSTAYKWYTKFLEYAGKDASWTFWCLNPNSGDTEGILKDDWVTVQQAKYALLKPYLAAQ